MEGLPPPAWLGWLNENVINPLLDMTAPLRENLATLIKPLFENVINPLLTWLVNLLSF